MKQMTIKKKITLWYTGIIALILGMVLGFMFYFVDKVGISATEEEVSTAVTGFSSNFQFQDGTYYLSEDTKFYEDGVMFCVYDDNGKLLYGTMPEKFPKQTMLKSFCRFLLVCLAASEGERDILFPVTGSRFVFQFVLVVFS